MIAACDSCCSPRSITEYICITAFSSSASSEEHGWQAEYFGPACQFKRCPSGDDPLTSNTPVRTGDVETNCEGVVAEGGKGVGKKGNLCHVDCSNRGICDHDTGTCTCFRGFWGSACEILKDLDLGGTDE